jgi:nitrite reductase/ring-hydroxylating ferredoxin subunit
MDLSDWTPVMRTDQLPVGKAIRVELGDRELFMFATEDAIYALDNHCSHQGGPLHRGRVNVRGSHPTATCPIHGSTFRMADGRVLRGPASRPQQAYDVRLSGDMVEVRARA